MERLSSYTHDCNYPVKFDNKLQKQVILFGKLRLYQNLQSHKCQIN